MNFGVFCFVFSLFRKLNSSHLNVNTFHLAAIPADCNGYGDDDDDGNYL